MKKREKEYVEFRYYEIPQRVPLIALMGERWVTRYGSDPMHFHLSLIHISEPTRRS